MSASREALRRNFEGCTPVLRSPCRCSSVNITCVVKNQASERRRAVGAVEVPKDLKAIPLDPRTQFKDGSISIVATPYCGAVAIAGRIENEAAFRAGAFAPRPESLRTP